MSSWRARRERRPEPGGPLQVGPANAGARVLVVSALEQKPVLCQAFKLGAADFLVKPFDRRGLVQSLDQMLPAERAAATP